MAGADGQWCMVFGQVAAAVLAARGRLGTGWRAYLGGACRGAGRCAGNRAHVASPGATPWHGCARRGCGDVAARGLPWLDRVRDGDHVRPAADAVRTRRTARIAGPRWGPLEARDRNVWRGARPGHAGQGTRGVAACAAAGAAGARVERHGARTQGALVSGTRGWIADRFCDHPGVAVAGSMVRGTRVLASACRQGDRSYREQLRAPPSVLVVLAAGAAAAVAVAAGVARSTRGVGERVAWTFRTVRGVLVGGAVRRLLGHQRQADPLPPAVAARVGAGGCMAAATARRPVASPAVRIARAGHGRRACVAALPGGKYVRMDGAAGVGVVRAGGRHPRGRRMARVGSRRAGIGAVRDSAGINRHDCGGAGLSACVRRRARGRVRETGARRACADRAHRVAQRPVRLHRTPATAIAVDPGHGGAGVVPPPSRRYPAGQRQSLGATRCQAIPGMALCPLGRRPHHCMARRRRAEHRGAAMKVEQWTWRCGVMLAACIGMAGCATYHPLPLGSGHGPNSVADVTVPVASMPTAALRAYPFDPANGLDVTEVAMLAVANDPQLEVERDKAGVAHAQAFAAGLLPDPQLNYEHDRPAADSPPGTTTAYTAGLTFDLGNL